MKEEITLDFQLDFQNEQSNNNRKERRRHFWVEGRRVGLGHVGVNMQVKLPTRQEERQV